MALYSSVSNALNVIDCELHSSPRTVTFGGRVKSILVRHLCNLQLKQGLYSTYIYI